MCGNGQQAVEFDLEYLNGFADFEVQVVLLGQDRAEIRVQLNQPENIEDQTFVYLWDNAKKSGLICGKDIDYDLLIKQIDQSADFNDDFNDDFNI